MSDIDEAIDALNEQRERLRADWKQRDILLPNLELMLGLFNDLLSKRYLTTTEEGRHFGKLLLQDERFIAIWAEVDRWIGYVYGQRFVETPQFDAKVAEFWSNQHYALLISPDSPEEAQTLAQSVLEDCEQAIKRVIDTDRLKITGLQAIADGVQIISEQALQEMRAEGFIAEFNPQDYCLILPKETAQIFSEVLIPLLHVQGRIFSGAYGSRLRDDAAFHRTVATIASFDSSCLSILERPPHIAAVILERIPLQNTARSSNNPEELEACLHLIDIYKAKYKNGSLYQEGGVIIDWATDSLNLSITAEIRGRCLLKLGRFEEAYYAFEDMGKYDEDAGRLVRAGWAEFFMAKAAKNLLIPGDITSHIQILRLLVSAKEKESTSPNKTWARKEIEKEIIEFDQLITNLSREENIRQPESILRRLTKVMVPRFESMADTPISVAIRPLEVKAPDDERKLSNNQLK